MDSTEARALVKAMSIMMDTSRSFDMKLSDLLKFILRKMNSRSGSIMIIEDDNLVVKASTNLDLTGKHQKLSGDSISLRAYRHGKIIRRDGSINDQPELAHLMRRPGGKKDMFISSPIETQGGIVGIFNISDKSESGPYTKKEALILDKWVRRISPVVENAKLTEDIRRERNKLKKANSKLRKLEKLKQDLMHMVIHDMKGPLQEIGANIDMVKSTNLDKFSLSCLESAEIGTSDLSRLIGNLLDISRMEEGRIELKPERIDARELVETALGKLRNVFKLNEITTRADILGGEVVFFADRSLMERTLANLLINAAEHSPEDSEVTVTALNRPDRDCVEIFVTDQGPGIPKELQKTIFKKFHQAGEKKTRGGSGLGLAFCHMAVKAHKGKIRVESVPGEGSRFVIELPVKHKAEKNGKTDRAVQGGQEGQGGGTMEESRKV